MSIRYSPDNSPDKTVANWWYALGTAVVAFVLYVLTLGPSWGFVDGGELSYVASSGGIAHPTGYPTVTLLGYLAALILPGRDVVVLNLFSAFLSACASGILVLLFLDLLRFLKGKGPDDIFDGVNAGLAALLVSTGLVWWFQGTLFEVYALHLVVSLLAILFFFRFMETGSAPEDASGSSRQRYGRLFALMLGLGFTTHLTIVLWGPALLFYYFRVSGVQKPAWLQLLKLGPWFLAGLLPYLYLPIRYAAGPVFTLDDLGSAAAFWEYVTGALFQERLFAGADVFTQQSVWFFGTLPGELAWGGLAIAMAGLVALLMRSRPLAFWSLLVFVVTVLWMGNYAILDVESQYLPGIIICGLWFFFGLNELRRRLDGRVVAILGILLVCLNIALHFDTASQADNRYAEELAYNVLDGLAENGVVISDNWDFWVSGSLYLQGVDGYRTDVEVIYATLLPHESYRSYLTRRAPELMRGTGELVEMIQKNAGTVPAEETRFALYSALIEKIIQNALGTRPVYLGGEIPGNIGGAYQRVPCGLAYQLIAGDGYVHCGIPEYRFSSSAAPGHYTAMVHELYARSLVARGYYEEERGKFTEALRCYESALRYDPGYEPDDVHDAPLNGEDQMMLTAGFFNELRAVVEQKKRAFNVR